MSGDEVSEGGRKVHTSLFIKEKRPGRIMYSMMNVVNNIVLYIRNFLRVDIISTHHNKKIVAIYGDRC